MSRYNWLCISLLFIVLPVLGWAQCDHKVEFNSKRQPDQQFTLYLKAESNLSAVVQLYDLYKGQVVQEVTMTLSSMEKAVFTKVAPSKYVMVVKVNGCTKPIVLGKGIEGIDLEH